jgi:hypothetical protein
MTHSSHRPAGPGRFISRDETAGDWAAGSRTGQAEGVGEQPDRSAGFGGLYQPLLNHWMVRQR